MSCALLLPRSRILRPLRRRGTLAARGFAAVAMLFIVSGARGKTGPTLETGWKNAATFLFSEAHEIFEAAKKVPGVNERERQLGEGVTLMNQQPRTQRNVARAREILERLATENPHDEAGIFGRYLTARVDQFHASPPRLDQARQTYRALLEQHAGHPVAESSAGSLVLMNLYENITPEERSRRFEELESLAPLLKTPSGRREYHLNLGFAYIEFGGSKLTAMNHLIAGDLEGITRWQIESATWIAIAELARAESRTEVAATYYGKFLAKYKRDNRHYTILKRFEALQKTAQR